MKAYINWCIERHDIVCNQKYEPNILYSFHLEQVAKEVKRFKDTLEPKDYFLALHGAWGHDLTEDARITYNDIVGLAYLIPGSTVEFKFPIAPVRSTKNFWIKLADVIYCLEDDKGKSRKERHSQKYFDELKLNKVAVFVKICDIIANVKYSKFSGSSMFKTYKEEFPNVKKELYITEYKELFDYLEEILNS